MKTLPSKTQFLHKHECWRCEEWTIYGQWDYCEKCEEPHFICKKCEHSHFKDGSKVYPDSTKFSIKIKKEMK